MADPGHFSFGAHNQRFLEAGEGMSMLAFATDDARRDQAAFAEKGLRIDATDAFGVVIELAPGNTA